MKAYKLLIALAICSLSLVSCELERYTMGEVNVIEEELPFDIPDDDSVEANPTITDGDETLLSNISIDKEAGYENVLRMNMTGVYIRDKHEWLELKGANSSEQNIWVEIDSKPRGFSIVNGDEDQTVKSKADIIFLVDNSGSMSSEANTIANEIIEWSQKISEVLDVRFACVGYDDYGNISGGLNITSVEELYSYLHDSGRTGTSRTSWFGGRDSDVLKSIASGSYSYPYGECGMSALRFADENFAFRDGSNRVYINFTDEPNQPNGSEDWSVEFLKDQENWNASQGTIHTVFSSSNNFTNQELYREQPWLMSEYTGGTIVYTSASFDVTLDDLTVTGALQNSAYLQIIRTDDIKRGSHDVKVTVLSEKDNVKAEKIYEKVSFDF